MDGLDRLMARGKFQTPASSRDMQEEFEELSAPIGAFIRDMCIVGSDQRVECQDLFQKWTKWCRDNGRDGHGTLQTFARDLKAQESTVSTVRIRRFGGSSAHFSGIGLAPHMPSYENVDDWDMKDD
jgi:phage/plasmid-associated DNA primase